MSERCPHENLEQVNSSREHDEIVHYWGCMDCYDTLVVHVDVSEETAHVEVDRWEE